MDDARIRQLTEDVLSKLAAPRDPVASDLEARVASLEGAVRGWQAVRGAAAPAVVAVAVAHVHPSLQLLGPSPGSERCCLEPDKPCVQSGQCRTLGH
jgi:hypothetical protein